LCWKSARSTRDISLPLLTRVVCRSHMKIAEAAAWFSLEGEIKRVVDGEHSPQWCERP
jgi:hypothetical protein